MVDTGLDELSCFFIDQTGAVEHSTMDEPITDLDRRKVRSHRGSWIGLSAVVPAPLPRIAPSVLTSILFFIL